MNSINDLYEINSPCLKATFILSKRSTLYWCSNFWIKCTQKSIEQPVALLDFSFKAITINLLYFIVNEQNKSEPWAVQFWRNYFNLFVISVISFSENFLFDWYIQTLDSFGILSKGIIMSLKLDWLTRQYQELLYLPLSFYFLFHQKALYYKKDILQQ